MPSTTARCIRCGHTRRLQTAVKNGRMQVQAGARLTPPNVVSAQTPASSANWSAVKAATALKGTCRDGVACGRVITLFHTILCHSSIEHFQFHSTLDGLLLSAHCEATCRCCLRLCAVYPLPITHRPHTAQPGKLDLLAAGTPRAPSLAPGIAAWGPSQAAAAAPRTA